jgi:predicted kinase
VLALLAERMLGRSAPLATIARVDDPTSETMQIALPRPALVVLVGTSGAGKSTFAARHFRESEVLSSDRCRVLVADDENAVDATVDAFDVLQYIAAKRLAAGRLCVVDATNLIASDRQALVALARRFRAAPIAIMFDLPEAVLEARRLARSDRRLAASALRRQLRDLRRSLAALDLDGFDAVAVLRSAREVDAVEIAIAARARSGPGA